VGKSKLAFQLAQRLNCEVISGDSMCVYRGFDIGTAKPSVEERMLIPHHLIDIRDSFEQFSVVEFQRMAAEVIHEVNQKGKLPILVGGTGLYVQALLEGFQFSATPKTGLRDDLARPEAPFSDHELHQRLQLVDPVSAVRIHPNDRKRIIRALEVAMTENLPISQTKRSTHTELLFDCLVIGLNMDRQTLYNRIDSRVDQMIDSGWINETSALIEEGIAPESTAFQAIGYKELAAFIKGMTSFDDAVLRIKRGSRRYAKRQLTWFRRMPYIQWVETGSDISGGQILETVATLVAEKFTIK
jgi:tRNA dimethylallyltransferase